MKKTLIVIVAIAILGILGTFLNKNAGPMSLASGSNSSSSQSGVTAKAMNYKDGTYTGSAADTPYGMVQIAAVISGGKIVNINFLAMPSDFAHSQMLSSYSEPLLKQTTLQAQSSNIDFVSGATSTSYGYQQSLQAALDQAGGTSASSAKVQSSQNSSVKTAASQTEVFDQ